MANMIIGHSFYDYSSYATPRAEDSNYPFSNAYDYWHLNQHFRTGDLTTGALVTFNFGASRTIGAVFLNDVNFDLIRVQYSDNGSDWSAYVGDTTISEDTRVGRYKIYIPTTDFDHQYMRLYLSPSVTRIAPPSTSWKVGTIVLLRPAYIYTLTENPSYPYNYAVSKPFQDNALKSGGKERIILGSNRIWSGDITFGTRLGTYETDFWTIEGMDICEPVIFYENRGYAKHAYLCVRDDSFSVSVDVNDIVTANTIRFTELV